MKFPYNIRSFREQKGVTRAQLAAWLNVFEEDVEAWENGERMPNKELYAPLARLFDVSVDELLHASAEDLAPPKHEEADKAPSRAKKALQLLSPIVMGVAAITYLLLGVLANGWHPWWCLLPAAALLCGVLSSLYRLSNSKSHLPHLCREIGRMLVIVSLLFYILYAPLSGNWHPAWVVIPVAAITNAILHSVAKRLR